MRLLFLNKNITLKVFINIFMITEIHVAKMMVVYCRKRYNHFQNFLIITALGLLLTDTLQDYRSKH